jgi:hypothetical protein
MPAGGTGPVPAAGGTRLQPIASKPREVEITSRFVVILGTIGAVIVGGAGLLAFLKWYFFG